MGTPEAPSRQEKDIADMTQTERFNVFYGMFSEYRTLAEDDSRKQEIVEEITGLRQYAHDYIHSYAPEMDAWLGRIWGLTIE